MRQKNTPPGDFLFPRKRWSIAQYNAHIQWASKTLGWPPSLKYDGSHTLRHAGIGHAKAAGITNLQLQLSEGMVSRYASPLATRVAKAAKKELSSTKKK